MKLRRARGTPLSTGGTDGSEHAQRALDWPAAEAALRGASVRVVTAWHVPAMVCAGGYAPMVAPSVDEAGKQADDEIVEAPAAALPLGERGNAGPAT